MADYQRTRLKRFAPVELKETPEGRYWRRFKSPVTERQFGAVTWLDFCKKEPHELAATASTRVLFFDGKNSGPLRSSRAISKFKDIAYSGVFRDDGKLVLAGCAQPVVKLFDSATRTPLRLYKGHSKAVRSVRFSSDAARIVSASDDLTVRLWDVPTAKTVTTLRGHTDYVRSLAASPSSPQIWASGSYDGTVRLWDARAGGESGGGGAAGAGGDAAGGCVLSVDHGAPVEAIMVLPGGGTLLSCGGNELRVWDTLRGGAPLKTFSAHQKVVTCCCIDGTGTRLISGSLDGHVKVYNLDTYEVTHGFKYDDPVLSVACAPDNSKLAVGCSTGVLSVRRRAVKLEETRAVQRASAQLHGGTFRYFLRGKNATAHKGDTEIAVGHKVKLQPHDVALKAFNYSGALDAALDTADPVVVITVLEELVARAGLRIALSGRDASTLEPLGNFVARYITHPKYAGLLVDVANVLFDVYAPVLGQSMAIDDMFTRLHAQVKAEVALAKDLASLLGALDLLMGASSAGGTGPSGLTDGAVDGDDAAARAVDEALRDGAADAEDSDDAGGAEGEGGGGGGGAGAGAGTGDADDAAATTPRSQKKAKKSRKSAKKAAEGNASSKAKRRRKSSR